MASPARRPISAPSRSARLYLTTAHGGEDLGRTSIGRLPSELVQYVRDHVGDPLNLLQGTYYGPSVGLRIDFAEYAAFKLQYNYLYQSTRMAGNGVNAQVAFTF